MKRILQALQYTILFSACTHLIVLGYIAIRQHDITVINYFNILDLEYFFPSIHIGALNQLLAVVVVGFVFFVAYRLSQDGY